MTDEPVIDLCGCERFQLWYVDPGAVSPDPDSRHQRCLRKARIGSQGAGADRRVCRCGHNDGEHLDGRLACVGRVRSLRRGAAPGVIL